MSIKLAVLDMAGTTVKDLDQVAISFKSAFASKNIELSVDQINPLMGYHKPMAIETLLIEKGLEPDINLVEDIHEHFQELMMNHYYSDPSVSPIEGIENVFESLKRRKIRVALNTGFSKRIAEIILNRFGWKEAGLIDDVIASDEVPMGRPYPFMIKELMRRAEISDTNTVAKVGDTPVDIEEGKNANCCYVIAVTTGPFSAEKLIVHNPSHLLHDLSSLIDILSQ